MHRRDFLRTSALVSGVIAVGSAACRREDGTQSSAATIPEPFALEEATIAELQAGMTTGQFTARSIVDAYRGRIDSLDRQGPALHAVIEVNPEAAAIADQLDRERQQGRVRGALHGIPVLLKDNIDTADRMTTTAASLR